jgi:hypothetical protein
MQCPIQERYLIKSRGSGSTVVEHLTRIPEMEGSKDILLNKMHLVG